MHLDRTTIGAIAMIAVAYASLRRHFRGPE
jgi:hypothetical protein